MAITKLAIAHFVGDACSREPPNGAFGRHERHDSAGMRLVTAAVVSLLVMLIIVIAEPCAVRHDNDGAPLPSLRLRGDPPTCNG
jgi:hypothetical protein